MRGNTHERQVASDAWSRFGRVTVAVMVTAFVASDRGEHRACVTGRRLDARGTVHGRYDQSRGRAAILLPGARLVERRCSELDRQHCRLQCGHRVAGLPRRHGDADQLLPRHGGRLLERDARSHRQRRGATDRVDDGRERSAEPLPAEYVDVLDETGHDGAARRTWRWAALAPTRSISSCSTTTCSGTAATCSTRAPT